MFKLTLFVILIVSIQPLFAQISPVSTLVNTYLDSLRNSRCDDICLVNDSTGYIITSRGYILKTNNLFNSISSMDSIGGYCRSIAFLNEEIGFVGGFGDQTGYLYETRDSGKTWQDITLHLIANDTVNSTTPHGVCGLKKAGNTIYACGAYFGRPFVARYNGKSQPWTYYDMRPYASGLVDMNWINADTGFVTGMALNTDDGGVVLRTEDGGINWTTVYATQIPLDYIWKLYRVNDSVIFGSVDSYFPNANRIIKSIDGGASWRQITVDSIMFQLQGVGFVNENIGYAGGYFTGYYATEDGGETWKYVMDTSVEKVNRFVSAGKGLFLVSGRGVYKTFDSQYTSVEAHPVISQPSILKLHPNPTSGMFSLAIDLSYHTRGHIVVYDILGKILEQIPHQPWTIGTHMQQFDSSQYPAGTYYVGFITDHGNWFAPVVVSR